MKRIAPITIFVFAALVGVAMAAFAWFASERMNQITFVSAADDAMNRIQARLELHQSLLRSAAAYFAAREGEVTRSDFSAFVAGLDLANRYTGIQGLGYARVVPRGGEAAAEAQIRANYGLDIAVWPETDAPIRAPIVLLEPLDERNRAAIGYDMYAETLRRAAMDAATRTGVSQATQRVQLVQEITPDKQAGFLIYTPFARPGTTGPQAAGRGAEAENPERPAGFVYAPFRAGDLFSAALTRPPFLPVSVTILDGQPGTGQVLFQSAEPPAQNYSDAYTIVRSLPVAGQLWTVTFRPNGNFPPSLMKMVSVVLGIVFVLLAAALAVATYQQQRALAEVAALQREAERNLVEKDLLLQEMKHRIKNSIARMSAIARQTAAGAASLEDFSKSFSARLSAMATSQDMLTRSRWQSADLKALLEQELEQVLGQGADGRHVIEGPPVELNETAAQAFGLTFHELATNALKYGSLNAGAGRLAIRWHIADAGPNARLVFEWLEEGGEPVGPPERTGFGTKLIDANIRMELGGTIERQFGEDGFRTVLAVPLANVLAASGRGPGRRKRTPEENR